MHLIGSYYKNISRCMVLWMSNSSSFVRRQNFSPENLPLQVEFKQYELPVCYNGIHLWGSFILCVQTLDNHALLLGCSSGNFSKKCAYMVRENSAQYIFLAARVYFFYVYYHCTFFLMLNLWAKIPWRKQWELERMQSAVEAIRNKEMGSSKATRTLIVPQAALRMLS